MEPSVALIPALQDNYVALLHSPDERSVAIIDPSEAEPVIHYIEDRGLQPLAILNTHHHPDHVGGNRELQKVYDLPVYASAGDRHRIPGLTHPMYEGDQVTPAGLDREGVVWAIPGHTRNHIAFLFPQNALIFTGDTLFAAGCGRLFEGTAEQMHASLTRLACLPESTRIYCGHEYTVKNLRFAQTVEPKNAEIAERLAEAKEHRAKGEPTLPSTIGTELRTNPFLRVNNPPVRKAVQDQGTEEGDPVTVLAALRRWKDRFH